MQQKKEKWYEMLIKLEIDTENIKRNLEKIKEINQNIICVLKDDAYGLGIEDITENNVISNKKNHKNFKRK